jgi:hypothetical protein
MGSVEVTDRQDGKAALDIIPRVPTAHFSGMRAENVHEGFANLAHADNQLTFTFAQSAAPLYLRMACRFCRTLPCIAHRKSLKALI